MNTTTAITPLAFSRGKGHASAYHMTDEEFTKLAKCHLNTCDHIETEFSSWSASLSFVLNKCPGVGTAGLKLAKRNHEEMHICIIDTKMLWETNQAFYVPLLDFMSPGDFNYSHEYLVHGIIEGPWYKAIPYSVLESSPGFDFSSTWYFNYESVPVEPLTKEVVEMARTAGKLFGPYFTLPVMLAILSCKRRDDDLWRHGVDNEAVEKVLNELPNTFKIPESWKKDRTITGHVISTRNYSDTKQMTRLMRAMVNHSKGKENVHSLDDESGDEESEYGEAPEDEPEETERAEGDSGETQAEGAADEADKVTLDTKVDQRTQETAQEEQVADAITDEDSKAGKIRGGKSKIPLVKAKRKEDPQKMTTAGKESEATSAAKAIWRRKYSKGSMRLQKALS